MRSGVLRLPLMGTEVEVRIWHADPQPILAEVERRLWSYDQRFSAHRETSELSFINRKAACTPVQVAPDLFEMIATSLEQSLMVPSHLNIALAPVIKLWRIGFKDARKPSEMEISQALALSDPSKVFLDREKQTVFLKEPGMGLDLGAVAKGYVADVIKAYLCEVGVKSGVINLGGNILTFGKAPHRSSGLWSVGLQDPRGERGKVLTMLDLPACSVVTSGSYERQLVVAGQTYHHVLSPQTGYPVETDMVSLTILSPSSFEGELLSSRLFGQPIEAIEEVLRGCPAVQGLIVDKTNTVRHLKRCFE